MGQPGARLEFLSSYYLAVFVAFFFLSLFTRFPAANFFAAPAGAWWLYGFFLGTG